MKGVYEGGFDWRHFVDSLEYDYRGEDWFGLSAISNLLEKS